MKKLRPWLVLMLVFLVGFTGGVVVTRAVSRHVAQRASNDPAFVRNMIERRLARRLRLEAEQRAKVDTILRQAQGDLKALRGDFRPRFRAIITQAEAQISETLTPQQRARFERFEAQQHRWLQDN